ncbi:MAG: GH3 auxin-responsive promoter family protein [Dehalococcoidales bacterium]|nr:GH3 auxin-responsive promoter family protein [Dehalococcoidales bacterium]
MQGIKYPMVKSDSDRIWQKYCGFLDLTLPQFMSVQEALLLQQLERLGNCSMGKRLMGTLIPGSVEEYRRSVPLTTYDDYLHELDTEYEGALPETPVVWASTFGTGGSCRRVPFTREAYDRALDNLMSVFLLSCSRRRGHSTLKEGGRVLYNVAPEPYLSGILASGASRSFPLRPVMTPEMHDGADFREKITKGFEASLRTGVDIMIAMTSVLVKTGNEFNRVSGKKSSSRFFRHPAELTRILRAYVRSKLEKRKMLPRDLWPVKALIGWGIDTSIYRDQVYRDWGAYPYEFHACTEAGIMAVQSWTRQAMTFIPHSNFFEFIPESEWLKSRRNVFYEPATVLLPDVRAGERYELVITSFYGMPFIRYRLGHLIRITDTRDAEAGIELPQMVFESRADDLIDIAGFTRISEKTVAQAISNCGLEYEDWTIRKEIKDGKPSLHLYIELTHDTNGTDLAAAIHGELTKTDPGYHDLDTLMEIHPMEVTRLSRGSFETYYREKQRQGLALAHARPPRVNASDSAIEDLLGVTKKQAVPVG